MLVVVEGFEEMNDFVGSEILMGFGEASSSESEWSEEEMSSSSEEGLVVDEDDDFGLPEMVIFLHEPIYRVCEDVVRGEKVPPLRCSTKYRNENSFESLERVTGISHGRDLDKHLGSSGMVSDGCLDDEARYGSGLVSFDEKSSVYKKVILVRDIEEVIQRSPVQKSNQVRMREEDAITELLDNEVVQYAVEESKRTLGNEKGLKDWNSSPHGNVEKLPSLKELMSMPSHVEYATNSIPSPPLMTYSMQKPDINTDLGQPCSDRQSFSFPILAKEWFGSPVRMAENSNKFSLQGLQRYFRCCRF